ncbi:hypothetical protein FCV25MIE_14636 [Fagus crenata]
MSVRNGQRNKRKGVGVKVILRASLKSREEGEICGSDQAGIVVQLNRSQSVTLAALKTGLGLAVRCRLRVTHGSKQTPQISGGQVVNDRRHHLFLLRERRQQE